jgi:hypothetical protein
LTLIFPRGTFGHRLISSFFGPRIRRPFLIHRDNDTLRRSSLSAARFNQVAKGRPSSTARALIAAYCSGVKHKAHIVREERFRRLRFARGGVSPVFICISVISVSPFAKS